MKPGRFSQVVAVAVVMVAGGVILWKFAFQPPTPPASVTSNRPSPSASSTSNTSEVITLTRPVREREVGEIRYLPANVGLTSVTTPLVPPGFSEGSRLITAAKALTDKDKDGEFISPRWSPDGLSILVSRPGFQGVYILDPATGEIRKVSDENGYNATWTADGRVAIKGDAGTTYLNADGSTAESGESTPPVRSWSENDTIYIAGRDGQPVALTGTDDRYFNPVTSPDGRYVVYQGLVNGLYIASTDGSSAPRWIGRGGNPSWMPDGSGFVFDRTTDDGHMLNSGNLIHLDLQTNQISNLTASDNSINQMPQVSPNGRWIMYESGGQVIVGSFQ
jgi:Tol biopolymer transport system component